MPWRLHQLLKLSVVSGQLKPPSDCRSGAKIIYASVWCFCNVFISGGRCTTTVSHKYPRTETRSMFSSSCSVFIDPFSTIVGHGRNDHEVGVVQPEICFRYLIICYRYFRKEMDSEGGCRGLETQYQTTIVALCRWKDNKRVRPWLPRRYYCIKRSSWIKLVYPVT